MRRRIEYVKNGGLLTAGLLAASMVMALPATADDRLLAEIDDLEPGDVEVQGFELDRAQEVRIEALGFELRRGGHKMEMAAAWILDAESREVVWDMKDARPTKRRRDLREFEEAVRLEAGSYEAYYATYPTHDGDDDGWWESAARSMARMFGWDDSEDYEEAVGDLMLAVRGSGLELDDEDLEATHDQLRGDAIIALVAEDDRSSRDLGFELEQSMELLIYAVGELNDNGGYDYGWIVDADTREKVWTFTFQDSRPAGGAKKNRVAYDTVTLPAGKYAASFVTDGSHSPEAWNALPPRDPSFWGLTLWAKDPEQLRYAKSYEYRHLPEDELVVAELSRMRDDEQRTHGFTLSEPMKVRVYALGEGHEHGMDDYGWIMNARSREKVWTMDFEQTAHAGGSKNNRVSDEMIRLDAGSYIVGFVTDGSHSYRDWNAAPPNYPERWGITLFGADGFDRAMVGEYREDDDPSVLARIARVRSHSHKRHEFTVDGRTEVSVYALGEGTHGEMYDYAWLEDARGEVIWEMTYPMTDRAGGASKNRLYHGTLELDAGEYVLHYQTDDSHAYRDWNASPPDDPDAWGVQVALIQ